MSSVIALPPLPRLWYSLDPPPRQLWLRTALAMARAERLEPRRRSATRTRRRAQLFGVARRGTHKSTSRSRVANRERGRAHTHTHCGRSPGAQQACADTSWSDRNGSANPQPAGVTSITQCYQWFGQADIADRARDQGGPRRSKHALTFVGNDRVHCLQQLGHAPSLGTTDVNRVPCRPAPLMMHAGLIQPMWHACSDND